MKTMLIIDDSAFSRTTIKLAAENMGIKVVAEAENGKEGAEKYAELAPDMVTVDLLMDGGDGIDAIAAILKHDPKATVLVVSSIAGQEPVVDKAMEMGVKKVFTKPFNADTFKAYAVKHGLV